MSCDKINDYAWTEFRGSGMDSFLPCLKLVRILMKPD